MATDTSHGPSLHTRLAKAETVLGVAFLTDWLVNRWLFLHPGLSEGCQTLIKMAILIGCFGPLLSAMTYCVNHGLGVTRTVSKSVLLLPRLAIHAAIMSLLFVGFYWSMHQRLPWKGYQAAPVALESVQESSR